MSKEKPINQYEKIVDLQSNIRKTNELCEAIDNAIWSNAFRKEYLNDNPMEGKAKSREIIYFLLQVLVKKGIISLDDIKDLTL